MQQRFFEWLAIFDEVEGTRFHANFGHLNGYSSHTYRWVNAAGEAFWVKYHYKVDQGVENRVEEKVRPFLENSLVLRQTMPDGIR